MSNPATSSGLKTADAAIMAMPGKLKGLIVIATGAAATVTLYDNASAASGLALAKLVVPADNTQELNFHDCGVVANNGIYADVSGADAAYIVHFVAG